MQCIFPASPRLRFAIEAAARCLMEEDLRAFPIQPMEIIRRRGWQMRTYAQMAARYDEMATTADVADLFGSRDAVSSVRLEHGRMAHCLICYNDQTVLPERLSFSLAHEIGHILLGHFAFGQPDGLPEHQARLLDAEANAFAANLLAPAAIVSLLRKPRQPQDRLLFGLSKAGWQTRLDTLAQDAPRFSPEEVARLRQQFTAFLYRRQCTACGAIFLHLERCPACGCDHLRWAPAEERASAFPWTAESWRVAAADHDRPENPLADDIYWPCDDRGL